jgi:hypothetical protein
MAKCQGKGCQSNLTDADAETSCRIIAAAIPVWMVKRPERRMTYVRRVFGPRCQVCRAKVIHELQV